MATITNAIVGRLLDFAETRPSDEEAQKLLKSTLRDSGVLERAIYGHASNTQNVGQQVIVRQRPGGYVAARVFYRDFIEPLVIRKGVPPRVGEGGGGWDCCLTNGTICCGSMCTDHVCDDPCPGGTQVMEMGSYASSGSGTSRLFKPERDLALGLAAVADGAFARRTAKAIDTEVKRLRKQHQHRELLFVQEKDAAGVWLDWILKLSNGSVFTLQVATSAKRVPLAFRHREEAMKTLRDSSLRWSFRASDQGHLVAVFRPERQT